MILFINSYLFCKKILFFIYRTNIICSYSSECIYAAFASFLFCIENVFLQIKKHDTQMNEYRVFLKVGLFKN